MSCCKSPFQVETGLEDDISVCVRWMGLEIVGLWGQKTPKNERDRLACLGDVVFREEEGDYSRARYINSFQRLHSSPLKLYHYAASELSETDSFVVSPIFER